MILPALALLAVQEGTETKDKSYAQILAMGRSKWHDFFVGRDAGATPAEAGAEGTYADALSWRTDRLRKPGTAALRKAIHDVESDALGVGTAMSGGGTMWTIVGASLYADGEETLYAVLTKRTRAPRRVVSDVDRAYAGLKTELAKAKPEGGFAARGAESLSDLRKDLDALVARAARRPRKESDALLDHALRALRAADTGE